MEMALHKEHHLLLLLPLLDRCLEFEAMLEQMTMKMMTDHLD
jgi:hypothetical protein